MKLNLNQVLYTIGGIPFANADQTFITVRKIAKDVLLIAPASEQSDNVKAEFKQRRYDLSIKIELCKEDSIDVPAEDIAMIKSLAVGLDTEMYGTFISALEGREHPVLKAKRLEKEKELKDVCAEETKPELKNKQ